MKTTTAESRRIMSISLKKLQKRSQPEPDDENKPAKKKSSTRFDGLSEEEVKKNTLKDILAGDLDLVFVGINPSLMAAHTGRYYAGPGNHFYKLLYESKLIPEPLTYEEDDQLVQHKIGLTNMIARATRSSADLSRAEIKKGATFVQDKLKKFKPKIAVFNGKCIYEEFADNYDKATFRFGLQPRKVGQTALWVVPSSSARCANFPRMQDKLHFYTSLKKYLAFLNGDIEEVNLEEFRFEGRCKQAVPSTSKMWRRQGISAFAKGGRIVNKETIAMNTSEEGLHIPRSMEFILKNSKKAENEDSERDSGISACQSDNSQEQSQDNGAAGDENDSARENNLRPRTRRVTKKTNEKKVQSKTNVNVPRKERSETIDFVSLIKQRLSNKEQTAREKEGEDCEDESVGESADNVRALKFANLRSNRSRHGFKVKTLKHVEQDD